MGKEMNEAQELLDQQLESLRAKSFSSLVERFTELTTTRFRRRERRVTRGEEIIQLQSPSGQIYDLELWAVLESEKRLRVFASVMGDGPDGQWVEEPTDFLIYDGFT